MLGMIFSMYKTAIQHITTERPLDFKLENVQTFLCAGFIWLFCPYLRNRKAFCLKLISPGCGHVGFLNFLKKLMKSTEWLALEVIFTSARHASLAHHVKDRLQDTKWQHSCPCFHDFQF